MSAWHLGAGDRLDRGVRRRGSVERDAAPGVVASEPHRRCRSHNRARVLASFALLGAVLLSFVIKAGIERPRPDLFPHGTPVYTASFPSGHSTGAAATYLTLGALLARFQRARRLKIYFMSVAVLLTLMIGLSRLYLGVHWPTDVLAGWTLGSCWALLCWMVARQLQRAGAVEPPEPDSEA